MTGTTNTVGDNKKEEEEEALQFIEELTSNVDEVQRRVLADILSRNAQAEYLQRHNLNGRTDRETFKNAVPVITYEDILPDIKRIVYGDKSPILCSQPISEFFTRLVIFFHFSKQKSVRAIPTSSGLKQFHLVGNSGTSGGESKMMPSVEGDLGRRGQLLNRVLKSVMSQVEPDCGKSKGMYILFIRTEDRTPGGLPVRPVLTSLYKSPYFTHGRLHPDTSPIETILCLDSYQSMYSQLLCGLCQYQQVLWVGAVFASTFVCAIRFLEKHWPLLCNDIRTGTIDTQITDHSVREVVMKILKPDPKLADFIKAECSKDSWQGIITRLWPNTKYVEVIVTGSMSQYEPILDYYSNSLPIVSTTYASSECFFGANLNPFCKPNEVVYTLIPTMAYFEFIPYHGNNGDVYPISVPKSLNEKERQQLVDLANVKIGQEYELVITTYSGLYRCRVSDVLRVAGFKNEAPQFKFLYRENVVLSIGSDKTTEAELQKQWIMQWAI